MSELKCVRVLLAAADRDIEILQLMHDSTAGPDEIFGFHAQQAAEKSLKAWLAFLGEIKPSRVPLLIAARFLWDARHRTAGKAVLNRRGFDSAVWS